MSLPRSYVDGFLVEWEAGEYAAEVKSMRQKSRELASEISCVAGKRGGGSVSKATSARAQQIRDRLARTVRKVPEVMVKITSSCKGMKQVGRHLDYISRKGQIEIEDQDGFTVAGKDELKDLKEEWRTGGPEEIAAESQVRDTLNIVFSMPAHTDEISMKRAVRAFAAIEFEGHQYIFAYHTQATDPDPNPPAHPHVHLSLKTQSLSGRRINPRKADLQRWREGFAAQLRVHGIEANATSRLARLKRERGEKRSAIALKERGEGVSSRRAEGQRGEVARRARAQTLEEKRQHYYGLVAETLRQSEDRNDRALGKEIEESLLAGRPLRSPDRSLKQSPTPSPRDQDLS